jgi:CelD/BcsL family acetyltransferase involved in cellulose biosynthesis
VDDDNVGVQVLESSRLEQWASGWDALVEQLPLPSPFLRSWWLEATAGSRPRFVLVAAGEVLLGGVALDEDRRFGVPLLRFMGTGPLSPDHLDLVARRGHEATVVQAVASWLRRPGWRILDLEGVVTNSRLRSALPGRVREQLLDVAPWTPLPDNPADFLATRSANFRANLRKATRRLDADGVTHRVTRAGDVEAALVTLRRLHSLQWGQRSQFVGSFERFAAASRAGTSRGEALFHELVAGETVIATVSCFEVAGRSSLYQSGRLVDRRWRNSTTVLLARVVEDACQRGLTEVDFLRGSESYKHNFATQERTLLRLRAAKGIGARLALAGLIGRERTRQLAGQVVRRIGAALPGLSLRRGGPGPPPS